MIFFIFLDFQWGLILMAIQRYMYEHSDAIKTQQNSIPFLYRTARYVFIITNGISLNMGSSFIVYIASPVYAWQ